MSRSIPCEQNWSRRRQIGLGSSARAHLAGRDDGLVRVVPPIEDVGRLADLMTADTDVSLFAALRDAEDTGRPLRSEEFVTELERLTGRRLRLQKPGRKPNEQSAQLELGIGTICKVSP